MIEVNRGRGVLSGMTRRAWWRVEQQVGMGRGLWDKKCQWR
jgi:hypothetical protein